MSKSNDATEFELNCETAESNIKKALETLKNWKFLDCRNPDILNVYLQEIETCSFDDKKMKNLANKSSNDWIYDVIDSLDDLIVKC